MIEALMKAVPLDLLANQLLMSAGITDPDVNRLVAQLVSGKFQISAEAFAGDSFSIPPGSRAAILVGRNGTEEVTLFVMSKKKP